MALTPLGQLWAPGTKRKTGAKTGCSQDLFLGKPWERQGGMLDRNTMAGGHYVHIGILGGCARCTGSLWGGTAEGKKLSGSLVLNSFFKIRLGSCFFNRVAETLFVLGCDKTLRLTGGVLNTDAGRCRSPCGHVTLVILCMEEEKFFALGSICVSGVWAGLCGWERSTYFVSPIHQQVAAERAPFLSKAFRGCVSFYLSVWKTTVFCSSCPPWDSLQQRQCRALGRHCVQLQHDSPPWGTHFPHCAGVMFSEKPYKCSISACMSFPQNVTTILQCNSELIKSSPNLLYHLLHEVTSFILFPFNLNLISISTFTFWSISQHASYFTVWSKQCRIKGLENLDWKYHENRLCQEPSSISCFWLSWKYSKGKILAQLKSTGILN